MATNYTGTPGATQAPSPPPSLNLTVSAGVSGPPIVQLPVDADAFNSAAFYQEFKTLADWVAYLQQVLSIQGTWQWPAGGFGGNAAMFNMAQSGSIPYLQTVSTGPWDWIQPVYGLIKGQIVTSVVVHGKCGGAAAHVHLHKSTGNNSASAPTWSADIATQVTTGTNTHFIATLTPSSPVVMDNDVMLWIEWISAQASDFFVGYKVI